MKSQPLTLDTCVVRENQIVGTPLGERFMMMSIEQGSYYDLNPTAHFVWQALAQPRKLSEVCVLMQQEYEVSEEDCKSAVMRFVQHLCDEGVARVVEQSVS